MKRYRIKLKQSARLIGPLTKEQIRELVHKHYIAVEDSAQLFPSGPWNNILEERDLADLFEAEDSTRILGQIDLFKRMKEKSEVETADEESELYVVPAPEAESKELSLPEEPHAPPLPEIVREQIDPEEQEVVRAQRTVIRKVRPTLQNEKTVAVQMSTESRLELEKIRQEIQQKAGENATAPATTPSKTLEQLVQNSETNVKNETSLDLNASTQFIAADEILTADKLEAIEQDFQKEMAQEGAPRLLETSEAPAAVSEEEQTPVKKKRSLAKSKKMTPVMAIIFIALIFYLMNDEDEKMAIQPVNPKIEYPISLEKADVDKSRDFLERGSELANKYTYLGKIEAAALLKQSLVYNRNDQALGMLLRVYAELAEHIVQVDAKDVPESQKDTFKKKAKMVLFQLIKESDIKSLTDVNVVVGKAKFFTLYGKDRAALSVLKKFKMTSKKFSTEYFTTYFDVAMKLGLEDELENINANIFSKLSHKSVDVYESMVRFLIKKKQYPEARALLKEALQSYDESVRLLLLSVQVDLYLEEIPQAVKTLQKVQALGAESSGFYYAQYLQYSAMIAIFQGNISAAETLLRSSLVLVESDEIRSRLATLKSKQNRNMSNLSLNSKIDNLVQKSQKALEEGNWKEAFTYALDAADLSEVHIPAQINLVRVQIARSYFNEAIKNLEDVARKFPAETMVTLELVKVYVDTYRLEEAKIIIGNISQTDYRHTENYAFMMAYIHHRSGEYKQAIDWYLKVLSINPLNDQSYRSLAEIYLRYKQFKNAKTYLFKAMDLDPSNVDYKIMYAKIIYEEQSPDAAIGFLVDYLNNFSDANDRVVRKDREKILAEIAIYNHRFGKLDQFKYYKDKLESEFDGSELLYLFLVDIAQIEDKPAEIETYAEKLIEINPGNIDIKMKLGEFFFENGKIDRAMELFEQVKNQLVYYPKVLYFISRIHLLKGNIEEAKRIAELEIKTNPTKEYGNLLLGEIYFKEKDVNKASQHYKKAQAINSNSIEALAGLAELDYGKSSYESALNLFLKASQVDPSNPEIRRRIGDVYRAMGQGSLAIESYKVYLDQRPDAEDAENIKKIISSLE